MVEKVFFHLFRVHLSSVTQLKNISDQILVVDY